MTRIRLQVTALAPLSFSTRRGSASTFTDTLSYLPGTSLRGAAAAHYLRNIGEPTDSVFQDLFVNEGILFANLYPQGLDPESLPQVLPATSRSCKAHSGFLADSSPEGETHGVQDILMRAAAFELLKEKKIMDEAARCPRARCDQPTHLFSGLYERSADTATYHKVDVYKRHLPHVGINRRTQTAEEGILYAQEVINEARREKSDQPYYPQRFSGDLIVQQQHVEFVKDELLPRGAMLWVGESRSRGLGRIMVSECAITASEKEAEIENRILMMNRQLHERCKQATTRTLIPVTLHSDAIIQDAFMRPKVRLEAEDLARAIGDRTAEARQLLALRLVYANFGTRLVQSWNVATGYPKPDDLAIRMGSVFLFEAPEGWREMAGALSVLQDAGVGKRRSEGFGRLSICDPFHMEVKELWQTI